MTHERHWGLDFSAAQHPQLHPTGFPLVFYPALPRLREVLPAVGPRALPQSQMRQYARGGVGDVVWCCGVGAVYRIAMIRKVLRPGASKK